MSKYKFEKMTQEQAIAFVRKLQRQADKHERTYIEALIELEAVPALWESGDATYAKFLGRIGTDPVRYSRGKKALGLPDVEPLINTIGMAAATQCARVDDITDRRKLLFTLEALAMKTEAPVPERTARTHTEKYLPIRMSSGGKLLESLRSEVKRLKGRVVELEAQLRLYRERFGNLKGTTRKAARKPTELPKR